MEAVILSYALDTNGQNKRYVDASRRWGSHPDVIKALAIGDYDPASVIGRYQAASEKLGTLAIRSVHRSTHMYQQMPADIVWERSKDRQILQLVQECDVLHLNNSWRPIQYLRRYRVDLRKPTLLHHHGSLFRQNPKNMLQEARRLGAVQCCSTVDLMGTLDPRTGKRPPEGLIHWMPTAYDVDWLEAFGKQHRREPDDRIRVVSAPTNRAYKSTDKLTAAVAGLISEGLPIELVLIEGKPWAEGMALKATADIYFDQVAVGEMGYPGGYGCNAVEAWGMGIPVIAGADEWTTAKMTELWGGVPFYTATEDSIADAIRSLATSKRLRTTWARKGMAHIRTYHDELPALTRLAELYRMAIDQAPAKGEEQVITTMFTAAVPQVRAAGKYVTFNPTYSTTNPHIVRALHKLAASKPHYGIEEVA